MADLVDSDTEEPLCPLCLEELDLTDQSFVPCQCGYQVYNCYATLGTFMFLFDSLSLFYVRERERECVCVCVCAHAGICLFERGRNSECVDVLLVSRLSVFLLSVSCEIVWRFLHSA